MNRILTFWIIAAISGFCVAEPVTKTRLAALHPRDGLVVTDVDMSGMLSTNDIHNIVTNGVTVGFSRWEAKWEDTGEIIDASKLSIFYVEDMAMPEWGRFWHCHPQDPAFDAEWGTVGAAENGGAPYTNADAVELRWRDWRLGRIAVTYRSRIEKNALGLAMAKDVEQITNAVPAIVTNVIPSIVTNTVDCGWSGWTIMRDGVNVTAAVSRHPRWDVENSWWDLTGVCIPGDYNLIGGDGSSVNVARLSWFDECMGDGVVEYVATRVRVTKNALGLAMLKDIEGAVTKQELTNTIRMVVNAAGRYVWDRELEVCYRLNSQGGFLDLIAVTNIDLTLPENYLALEAIENEWRTK